MPQSIIEANGEVKYLGVAITSDENRDEELDVRSNKEMR